MATAVGSRRADAFEHAAPLPERTDAARDLAGEGLSPREFEIARLTCRGMSNKEIAQVLEISHHTVSTHMRRVFDKLRINRRAKLAAYVAERLAHGRRAVGRK